MSAKVFAMPVSPDAMARIGAAPVDLARQALGLEQQREVIVLPAIRRDEACGVIAVPTFAEQAKAVGELHDVVCGLLPRLPLLELREADALLHRLQAAAATLRRLAEGEAS